jgi:hypothetical protein
MIATPSILPILLLLLIAFSTQPTSVRAQFGIKRGGAVPIQNGDEIMMTRGDELSAYDDVDGDVGGGKGGGEGEKHERGFLSEKDASDMSAIIEEAKRDLETMAMITKMRDTLSELRKLSAMEVLGGMKQALDNMKLIEYLFEDKERAVREMEKEGMIDKAHIKKYRKDPSLLEMDTRRGLYFQFISLAVVGGFIE